MQRLEHAAQTHAARQMHIVAHLGATADRGPSVHHGALAHIGAYVHIAGHQNRAFGDKAATAGGSGRHDAHASGFELLFAHAGKFGRHFVVKRQIALAHGRIVAQAERQKHRFFQPLVYRPFAHRFTRGNAQAAAVEFSDGVLNRVENFFGRTCRR